MTWTPEATRRFLAGAQFPEYPVGVGSLLVDAAIVPAFQIALGLIRTQADIEYLLAAAGRRVGRD